MTTPTKPIVTQTIIDGVPMTLDMMITCGDGFAYFWHAKSAGSDKSIVIDDNNTVIIDQELDYIQALYGFLENYPSDIVYVDSELTGHN